MTFFSNRVVHRFLTMVCGTPSQQMTRRNLLNQNVKPGLMKKQFILNGLYTKILLYTPF